MTTLTETDPTKAPPGKFRLRHASPEVLSELLRSHVASAAGGRCRRCGFRYSTTVRECPAARAVGKEIKARAQRPPTKAEIITAQRDADTAIRPCLVRPEAWDLDCGNYNVWMTAIAACTQCPFRAECRTELQADMAEDAELRATMKTPGPDRLSSPRSMIKAALAFDSKGRVIDRKGLLKQSRNLDKERAKAATPEPSTPQHPTPTEPVAGSDTPEQMQLDMGALL